MIPWGEIARPIVGAWLILGNRSNAMSYFDTSRHGLWLSFAVLIVVLVPTYFLLTLILVWSESPGGVAAANLVVIFASTIADVIGWIALPVLLAFVARPLGIADRAAGFVVARNWAGFVLMLFVLAFVAVEVLGAAAASLLGLGNNLIVTVFGALGFALLALVIRYAYLVVRLSLGFGLVTSLAVVALDLVLQLVVGTGLTVLFGFGQAVG